MKYGHSECQEHTLNRLRFLKTELFFELSWRAKLLK